MHKRSFLSVLGAGFMMLVGVGLAACDNGGGGTGGDGGGGGGGDGGGGAADCGNGATMCGGACTVTSVDPENCGTCGNACGDGEVCNDGQCDVACGGGTTDCDGSCVDTASNAAHCGACGNACDDGEVCASSECVALCGTGGLALCGGICVDMMNDAQHCGGCATVCGATDSCVSGQCTAKVPPKGVYTMTNDAAGNKILAFERSADGSLSPKGTFTPTGGLGSGNGLGNQRGLVFDDASGRFFAVNAGDNSVSMLALELDGSLTLLSKAESGGVRPVSVTVSGDLVYVVNAGSADDGAKAGISGLSFTGDTLSPIAGSTQPLSADNPGPAQIQFSPDGQTLVVTEKGTSMIDTFAVAGGVAKAPMVSASAGPTPFGFDFDAAGHLLVSEAAGGAAGMSSASSYTIGADGLLSAISAAVPTGRTAACWLVLAGEHAYVTNGPGDITGFQVAGDGALSLLDADGVTATTSGGATDEDVTDDGDFLYVMSNGAHVFSIYEINGDGSLTQKPDFAGLPSGVNGVVAR